MRFRRSDPGGYPDAMSGPTPPPRRPPRPVPRPGGAAVVAAPRRRRFSILTRRDKLVMALMVGIPTVLCLFFIWLPTILSVVLSFTNWQGYTPLTENNFIGLKNYEKLFTTYPFFWPAVWHNILWLLTFVFIATPIGIFLAVLLDREMRGTRIYQSAFFIPVVLSLAIIGFIWQLQYTSQGFINSVLGRHRPGQRHRLAGESVAQHLGRPRGGQLAPRRLRDGPLPGRPQERRSHPPRGRRDRRRQRATDLLPGRLPGDAADQHRHRRHHRHRVAARVRHRLHHQPAARTASNCCRS